MAEQWRRPTEEDRGRVCKARNNFEKGTFKVEWNDEYKCWALEGRPHILVLVSEVVDV